VGFNTITTAKFSSFREKLGVPQMKTNMYFYYLFVLSNIKYLREPCQLEYLPVVR
jgi:hypothetical protein